jgi:DNA-binding NtrC family response regulator
MTLAANLELEGLEVVEAESGGRALELAKAQPFDAVLTDIRMPGMTGVELFRQLRTVSPNVPVVLMTAFTLEEVVQSALEDGAFTLLSKPFDVGQAARVLASAVRLPVVLIIDDAESVAVSTAEALAAAGLRAKAVTSGEEAVRTVQEGKVDVCVVDMLMPEQSGPEVIESLRRLDPKLLMIAISGHDVPEMIQRVATSGIHTFLKKPFRTQDLVRAVATARAGT